jgi:uncharacterized membrane protein (DUF106 family)
MAEIRKEEREEKMVLLDVKIKELLQKVEEAGEEGRVQEAADMQKEVEKLQEELTHIKEVSFLFLFFLSFFLLCVFCWV